MGIVIGIVLVWFIIEMLLWVLLAQFMSGWYVFFWFVLAGVLGIGLIKNTIQTLNPMAQQMKSGVIPNPANMPSENTIAKSMAKGLAGLLLLLPGLLSDVLAVLLLLPFIQKALTKKAKDYAAKNQDKMMAMMAKQMGGTGTGFGGMGGGSPFGQNPFAGGSPFGKSPFGGTTVDGTAKDINKSNKKLSSSNDE